MKLPTFTNRTASFGVAIVTFLFALAATPAAWAQTDHRNLDEGFPVTVEDAYATPYLNREFQLSGRYDRTGDDTNRFTLQPRLEYGFARNWQGTLTAPFYLGNADRTGSGNTEIDILHNFNTESLTLPAFGLSGRAIFPSGTNSRGVDYQAKFIVTRSIDDRNMGRVHANILYYRHNDASPDERSNRLSGILGYSRRAGPNAVFVSDYLYQQERQKSKADHLLEAGFRYQQTPSRVLSAGLGAGLNRDAPKVRLTLGIQQSF